MSWNVNGLRAIVKKNFKEFLHEYTPDVLCVQETKAQQDNLTDDHTFFDGYEVFLESAQRKGYSGVATYTRKKPLNVIRGIANELFDNEGRVLTLEFEKLFVVNVYVPNAQPGLVRIKYREQFNDELLLFIQQLEKKKPVVLCGDMNVAHQEIDLTHPSSNRGNPGFSDEERAKFNKIIDAGFIDTFRFFHPDTIKYSWWSYRMRARERNVGWRIDYCIISQKLKDKVKTAEIHNEVYGSDHCPVSIRLK